MRKVKQNFCISALQITKKEEKRKKTQHFENSPCEIFTGVTAAHLQLTLYFISTMPFPIRCHSFFRLRTEIKYVRDSFCQ